MSKPRITGDGILTAAKIMESRLLDLRICGDTITENYLTDSSLGKIAASCPNLQHFAYKLRTSFYYNEELDRLTGTGILSLVTNCRRLEVLELENAKRVGRETFDEIIQMLARANESKKVAKAAWSMEKMMTRSSFTKSRFWDIHSSLWAIHFVLKIPAPRAMTTMDHLRQEEED